MAGTGFDAKLIGESVGMLAVRAEWRTKRWAWRLEHTPTDRWDRP